MQENHAFQNHDFEIHQNHFNHDFEIAKRLWEISTKNFTDIRTRITLWE